MKGRIQKLGNRLLGLALLAALLLTLVPTAAFATSSAASNFGYAGTTTGSQAGFPDVPEGHVFYTYVNDAARLGIIHGYSDGTFRPANTLSRRNVVRMLANMAGLSPDESDETAVTFVQRMTDVNVRDLNEPALRWFLCDLLYSAAQKMGEKAVQPEVCTFPDCAGATSDVRSAIGWCAGKGIVNGYRDGNFGPNGSLTRGAAAKVMVLFWNYLDSRSTSSDSDTSQIPTVIAPAPTPSNDGTQSGARDSGNTGSNGNNSALSLSDALAYCYNKGLFAAVENSNLLVYTKDGHYDFTRANSGQWQAKVGGQRENISTDGVLQWIDNKSAEVTTSEKLQVASDRLSRLATDRGLTPVVGSIRNNTFTFAVGSGSNALTRTISINTNGALVTDNGSLQSFIEALKGYQSDSGDSGNTTESNQDAPLTVDEAVEYSHEYGLFAVSEGANLYVYTGAGRYEFVRGRNGGWQVKSGNALESISTNGVRNWIATQSSAATVGEKLRVASQQMALLGNSLGLTSEIASVSNSAFTFTVIGNSRLSRTISIDRDGALVTDNGSLQSYFTALEDYAANHSFKDQLDEQVDHFVSEAEALGWQTERTVVSNTSSQYTVRVASIGTHYTYTYTVTTSSSDPVPVWDNGGTVVSFNKVLGALNNAQ